LFVANESDSERESEDEEESEREDEDDKDLWKLYACLSKRDKMTMINFMKRVEE
jgi:hypothetical protein